MNHPDIPPLSGRSHNRRDFLKTSLLGAALPLLAGKGFAAASSGLGPIRREVFIPYPKEGITVLAATHYTRPTGRGMISIHQYFSRSDTVDKAYFRYSTDNGRTWSKTDGVPMGATLPVGKLRQVPRSCILDPVTGRLIYFWIGGILPNDDPLEGMKQWITYYRVSEDGGYTWYLDDEVIVKGKEYNSAHPMAGVWKGRTGVMIGDIPSQPIFLADGTLLQPVEITPTGPDGSYHNPTGAYTFTDVAVLRGRWETDGRRMEWDLSERVTIDPNLSTRGMDEPTLAVLADGRILMIMRGSNDKRPHLPARRWMTYSSDQGRTWTKPAPWTYAGGENFYSPSSSSQMVTHSAGRIFWIGNITPENPNGNRPRYPMVIGEVDRASGLLRKETVRTIDDRGPHESALVGLSSPSAREDRETGEIVLNMTRFGEHSASVASIPFPSHESATKGYNFTASAYLYRIPV